MKKTLITVLGFAVSIVLLYLSLRGLQFQDIWNILRHTNPGKALLPLVFISCAACLASFRWSRVAGSNVHFTESFTALLIGLFVNNVLPARLGEVARGYVLSRKKNLSFTYAISTVVLDRFFDLTGLLILLFLFFPRHNIPPRISQGIYVLLGLLVFGIVGFIFLSRPRLANHLSARFTKVEKSFLSRFAKRLLEVQANLTRISSPFTIIWFAGLSFLTWFSMSVGLYWAAQAVGVKLSFIYFPFVCALLNMGLTIPSSPGYFGVYQALIIYLLSIFDVPKTEGFTVSVLFHASWYIPYTILGFLLFLKEHLRIKDIQKLTPAKERK